MMDDLPSASNPSHGSKRVVIFGAAADGRRFLDSMAILRMTGMVDVVAFADNDSRLHGRMVCGVRVIRPDQIAGHEPDLVVVTPIFWEEAVEQLSRLGVPRSVILPYREGAEEFAKTDRATSFGAIGAYSYYKPNTRIWNTEIGRFCHIGDNCLIGLAGHNPGLVTTYPLRMHFDAENPDVNRDPTVDRRFNAITRIGNDVYIGEGAIIYAGVDVSDGAVIAARSIVTRNVSPYAIVAGAPAREIRRRFEESQIDHLLKTKWWDWPAEEITENLKHLEGPIDDFMASRPVKNP